MVMFQVLVVDVTSEVFTPHLTPAFLYVCHFLSDCPFFTPSLSLDRVPGPKWHTGSGTTTNFLQEVFWSPYECHRPPSQINVNKRNNCQLGEVSIYYSTHVEVTGQPVGVKAFLLPRGSMIQVRFSGLVAGAFTHGITSLTQCLNF